MVVDVDDEKHASVSPTEGDPFDSSVDVFDDDDFLDDDAPYVSDSDGDLADDDEFDSDLPYITGEDEDEDLEFDPNDEAAVAARFGISQDELIEDAPLEHYIGRVAVVGYPNVGKSTLVNRLSDSRTTITHKTSGVTRDRKEVPCEWNGSNFMLIDTGGVDAGDPRPIAKQIIEQAKLAIAEADMILLIVDSSAGMSAADEELAEILRPRAEDTIVVANKVDHPDRATDALEFWSLGLGEPMVMSAAHGAGSGDLLDAVVTGLRERGSNFTRADEATTIKIALVGRPNVGKSTLVNAMLGSDRTIVADWAGTTRDAIDTPFRYKDRDLVLIDTAGIRRKKKERDPVEFYGEVRSFQAADRADIAILLVDASDGLRETDMAIADEVRKRHCATIIALSKWDVNEMDLEDVQLTIKQKMRQRPGSITTSGVTGRNVTKLLDAVIELHERYSSRAPTAALNELLGELKDKFPPPANKKTRRRLNILYGTQYQTAPPRFRLFVNDRGLLTRSYGFMLENRIRERFNFEGCPVIIDVRDRSR